MLLPVRRTTARRIPGQFIKVLMVLEEQLLYLVLGSSKELGSLWAFFMQKANVTPTLGGFGRGGPICLSCLPTVVISVKDYFLGASMASSI